MTQSLTALAVPVLSKERFAELVGVDVEVVRGWINRGHVPVVKIGRRCLINVAAMTEKFKDAL